MKREKKIFTQGRLLFITIAFYITGAFLIPNQSIEELKENGYAEQEKYTYVDDDGEEHDGETLIDVKGIGYVLTYDKIYFSTLPFFVISALFARFVFDEDTATKKEGEFMVYSSCILGSLLIWLTKKECIASTILFWLGIITSYYAVKYNEHKKQ